MIILDNRAPDTSHPFFSIITVVRNGVDTLQRCIDSITSQTFQDFEYLVIDGASTDGTIEIIKKNSEVISLAVSDKDQGLYFAMNKGLDLARGRYIGILNSDDTYNPETLKLVFEAIIRNPKVSIVYGSMRYFSHPNILTFIHSDALSKTMILHPTCFVSKSTYLENGKFNTKYRVAADYEFMLRCKHAGLVFLDLPNSLANFSDGGTSERLKYRSILETSEIQAKYNNESWPKKYRKFLRVFIVTYGRSVVQKILVFSKHSGRLKSL